MTPSPSSLTNHPLLFSSRDFIEQLNQLVQKEFLSSRINALCSLTKDHTRQPEEINKIGKYIAANCEQLIQSKHPNDRMDTVFLVANTFTEQSETITALGHYFKKHCCEIIQNEYFGEIAQRQITPLSQQMVITKITTKIKKLIRIFLEHPIALAAIENYILQHLNELIQVANDAERLGIYLTPLRHKNIITAISDYIATHYQKLIKTIDHAIILANIFTEQKSTIGNYLIEHFFELINSTFNTKQFSECFSELCPELLMHIRKHHLAMGSSIITTPSKTALIDKFYTDLCALQSARSLTTTDGFNSSLLTSSPVTERPKEEIVNKFLDSPTAKI